MSWANTSPKTGTSLCKICPYSPCICLTNIPKDGSVQITREHHRRSRMDLYSHFLVKNENPGEESG